MKKLLCVVLAVILLLSCAGCVNLSYEDTNGEDNYALQTLTDADILRGASSSTVLSSKVTVNDKTECKAKTMSGVVTLLEKKLNNEPLHITVSCKISKGNARLVLVLDDKIIHDFALNTENQTFTLSNVTGKVRLKIAGESAGYEVTCIWK